MVIMIGMLSVIACTGCTAFVAEDYPSAPYSASVPIETSHAMRVAVPAPIGTPRTKRPTIIQIDIAVAPVDTGVEAVKNTLVEYGVELPPTYGPTITYNTSGTSFAGASPFNDISGSNTLLTGFRPDILAIDGWSGSPELSALRGRLGAQRLAFGTLGQQRYDASFSFAAPREATGLKFDIGVVPSASYASEGDFSVRRVGAEFRLGQDIDQRGNNAGLPSWYFFAGADGEAVIFNNSSAGRGLGLVNGIQLRDQVTVGDIQAGLNIRQYGTNFALNYVRREVEYEFNSAESFRRNEDFGGITLTWRR